jgi:hypothetical protein
MVKIGTARLKSRTIAQTRYVQYAARRTIKRTCKIKRKGLNRSITAETVKQKYFNYLQHFRSKDIFSILQLSVGPDNSHHSAEKVFESDHEIM